MATQLQMLLIERKENDEIIYQRAKDGYINATAMCKACNKRFNDYMRLSSTIPFLTELSSVAGIPATELIHSIQGGTPEHQGTWVHPQVAINLGQWLSPKFAVLVTQWVQEWFTGNFKPQPNLPYHLKRYVMNLHNVPYGHFSVLNEITFLLIAPMEKFGYTVSGKMVPDISLGRTFANHLRKLGHLVDNFPRYNHIYDDGRTVEALAYPNELLAEVRKFYFEDWLRNRSQKYFSERDKEALPYLEKILTLPNYREVMGYIE